MIRIDRIMPLSFKKGDVFVAEHQGQMSQEAIAALRESWSKNVPGTKLAVLSNGLKLVSQMTYMRGKLGRMPAG